MLRNAEVAARIKELQYAKAEKVVLSRAWVLEELRQNYERAMQADPVLDREGNETGKFTYAGTVAVRSLELIGKELGMFLATQLERSIAAECAAHKWVTRRRPTR